MVHAMSKRIVEHLGYYTNGQCMFPARYMLRKKNSWASSNNACNKAQHDGSVNIVTAHHTNGMWLAILCHSSMFTLNKHYLTHLNPLGQWNSVHWPHLWSAAIHLLPRTGCSLYITNLNICPLHFHQFSLLQCCSLLIIDRVSHSHDVAARI